MTDRIDLTGLRVRGRHGVFDFEREQGQDFVVDVRLELDLAPAARSDDVTDTVHYGELAERLVAIVSGEPVNLIETLAERLAAACLADRRVTVATVTVHKPQAPIPHDFADVAVTLRRARRSGPAEPGNAGPGAAERGEAGPGEAGPDQAGPDQAGPDQAGPDQAGPDQAGPSEMQPGQVGRGQAGSGQRFERAELDR